MEYLSKQRIVFRSGLLAALLLIPILISCGTAGRLPKASLADTIWSVSQTHPDGFTLDIRTLKEPTEGICVAYSATQNSHGRQALDAVISHAVQHDGFVGGWLNPADSLYYFDSIRLFPEDSLQAAISFGLAGFQKVVYKLSTGEDILLKEESESVSPTNLIIMYDSETGKDALLAAVKSYGAEILYEYNIIPGIAIKVPGDINKAIEFFSGVTGVVAVQRDHIYHITD